MLTSNLQPIRILDPDCLHKFACLRTNCVDPDKFASDLDLHCLYRQDISGFRRTGVNSSKPNVTHKGHWQIVLTQITRRRTRRLIRVYSVCIKSIKK